MLPRNDIQTQLRAIRFCSPPLGLTLADLWGLNRNLTLDFVSNLLMGTLLINRNQLRHAASSVPHRRARDVQLGKSAVDCKQSR
jgi:hypothetical protein